MVKTDRGRTSNQESAGVLRQVLPGLESPGFMQAPI